jgi:hypothetical protein
MRKLIVVAALMAVSTTADAAITVFFDGDASGNYQYHIEQAVGDIILPEDFFILYNFGPNSLVSAPEGWNYASSLSDAMDPWGVDNPAILNVNFTSTVTTNATNIGPFILSTPYFGPAVPDALSWFGTNTNQTDNTKNGSVDDVAGPQSVVPEPASMSLMAAALLGLGVLVRWRQCRREHGLSPHPAVLRWNIQAAFGISSGGAADQARAPIHPRY